MDGLMADMIPAAASAQPYNPMQGVGMLSSILGIKQQQQQLQTGQYVQQQQQAGAIQAQQSAKELQAGAKLMSDPVGNGIIDQDGNPTDNAYSIIKSAMPTTGDEKYQQLLKVAQGHVEFKNAAANLSQNEQGYVSSRLAGIVADPDAHVSDVESGVDDLNAQFKGTAAEKDIARLTTVIKSAVDDTAKIHGMDGVRQVINGFSRGAIGNAGITGSGGVANPEGTTNAAGQIVNRNQITGALSAPPVAAPAQTTQIPGAPPTRTAPTGGLGVNPTAAQVSAANAQATGGAGIDVQRASDVSGAMQSSAAGIPLTQQADRLVDMISSGRAAEYLAEKKIAVGANGPEATARVELGKILAQIQNNTAAGAGASSVEKLQQLAAANPKASYPTDAVHAAMDLARGTMRQSQERGQLLGSWQSTHGNAAGFSTADNALTSAHTPLAAEFNALSDPAAKAAFIKRQFPNDRNSAKAFMAQVRGAYHAVPGGQ
jgi:hypothetical protein